MITIYYDLLCSSSSFTIFSLGTIVIDDPSTLEEGSQLVFGNYECEIQEICSPRPTKVSLPPLPNVSSVKKEEPIKTKGPVLSVTQPSVVTKFRNPLIHPGQQRVANKVSRVPLYDIEAGYVLPRPPNWVRYGH